MNTLTIYSSSTPSKNFTYNASKPKAKRTSSVMASMVLLASTMGVFTSPFSIAQSLYTVDESREINSTTTSEQGQNNSISKQDATADKAYKGLVIDINTSSLDELLTLKGIGQKKAEAILAYREKFGGFSTVEELSNIKGIGEKILKDNMQRLKI
ncbi:MAG: ComEA family DNA-binding protein [Colwellia sp.]